MHQNAFLDLLTWTPWQPLRDSWLAGRLPDRPGLYRIRRAGRDDLDYIGQTGAGGMTVRKRAAMLSGVYADEMPYRDPHTAGPALWALRHASGGGGADFEVSVAPIEGMTPWRKGLECVAISRYRAEHGRSPTVNWGRMPAGYRMSSGNNARLVATGKRRRGGPTDAGDESHLPGIPPVGALGGDLQAADWCGHVWSPWASVAAAVAAVPAGANGLYRIRRAGDKSSDEPDDGQGLLYIGQGLVGARLAAHAQKARIPAHTQAGVFAGPLACSWVLDGAWHAH